MGPYGDPYGGINEAMGPYRAAYGWPYGANYGGAMSPYEALYAGAMGIWIYVTPYT